MSAPNNRPPVCVILIVKNGAKYLAQALASIHRQTWPVQEILVVDGQSEDETAEIARSHFKVRYLRQENQGIANARNRGLEETRCDWIAFLDHDDLWLPNKLQSQLETAEGQPELAYLTCLMRLDHDGKLGEPRPGCTPSALLARRAAFDRVGYFDPRFQIACDAEWFTRARDEELPTAVVPEVLVHKRLHGSNISRAGNLNRSEMLRIAKESAARRRR